MISRAWTVALTGSGVGHVALAVALSMMPDQSARGGASKRDALFTSGAVIPIETTTLAMPSKMPSEATAPFDEPRSDQPSPKGRSEAAPSSDPTPTQAEPPNPGLVSGMRDKSSGAAVTGPGKVVVDPALLGGSREAIEESVGTPGVGTGAEQGPAAPRGSSDLSFTREKGKLIYRDPGSRFVATLRSDGRVDFKNKSGKLTWTDNAIGDPDALIRMAAGEDPYARAKAELLKATFEMRLGMAVTFQKKLLDKRLTKLEGELDDIWSDGRRDLPARRELLFQRWDECDEDEGEGGATDLPGFGSVEDSELDEARRSAGKTARERIEKFVRKHAPKGSPEAYSASELADMNKRRTSKQAFDPYQ